MSNSQHPVALAIERRVGGSIRLLATVMALPLVDGIFPALILAGALDTTGGILQVGLLVFGGSATVAVVLAEMSEDPRSRLPAIAAFGIVLVVVAAVEAALAPAIGSALDLVPGNAALAVLVVTAVLAFDPGTEPDSGVARSDDARLADGGDDDASADGDEQGITMPERDPWM